MSLLKTTNASQLQKNHSRLAAFFLLLPLLATPLAAEVLPTISIGDTEFAPSHWSSTVSYETNSATEATEQRPTGGTPDAYRFTQFNLPPAGAENTTVIMENQFLNAVYTPRAQGAITSLTFSEDRIQFSPPFAGAKIGAAPILFQDGITFVGPSTTYGEVSWTNRRLPDLTAADFVDPLTGRHPDFTRFGNTIYFGYRRSNSTGSSGGLVTQHGIDNFEVEIARMGPLPVGAPLLGLADLEKITIEERTGGSVPGAYDLAAGDSRLRERLPLLDGTISDLPTFEAYDAFASDALGQPDESGAFLTLECIFPPGSGGGNVAEITLVFTDGRREHGSMVTAFRAAGTGASPASVRRAIDGNPQTHTKLGTSSDQDKRLFLTVGFESTVPRWPKLSIATQGDGAVLRWDSPQDQGTLQVSGDLAGGWTDVMPLEPTVTQYILSGPLSDSQFYRLDL